MRKVSTLSAESLSSHIGNVSSCLIDANQILKSAVESGDFSKIQSAITERDKVVMRMSESVGILRNVSKSLVNLLPPEKLVENLKAIGVDTAVSTFNSAREEMRKNAKKNMDMKVKQAAREMLAASNKK